MRARINPFALLRKPEMTDDIAAPSAGTILPPIKLTDEILAACRNVRDMRESRDRTIILHAKNLAGKLPGDTTGLSREESHDLAERLQETSEMLPEVEEQLAAAEQDLIALVLDAVAANTKLSRTDSWKTANETREAAADRWRRRAAQKRNSEDHWGFIAIVHDDFAWIEPRSGKPALQVMGEDFAKMRRAPKPGDRVMFEIGGMGGARIAQNVVYLHPTRQAALYPDDQAAVEAANVR